MNYKRLSTIELSKYRYPNLLAEIIESGYSICTIAEHMGLGRYRKEDDPEVLGRLNGSVEMSAANVCGLLQLYNVEQGYLFSDTLSIEGGMSKAYWRWYDENKRKEQEFEHLQALSDIYRNLHENLYLTPYVQAVIDYIQEADDEIEAAQNLVKSLN